MVRKREWFPHFFLFFGQKNALKTIPTCQKSPIRFQFSYSVIVHILCSHLSWQSFQVVAMFTRKLLQLQVKARFRCWQRTMDININTLLQILYLWLALHYYIITLFWVKEGKKFHNRALRNKALRNKYNLRQAIYITWKI